MNSANKKRGRRASISEKSPYDDPLNEAFFAKTDEADEAEPKAEEQEPAPAPQSRTTSLKMYEHQLDWLDRMCIEARKKGGKAIRKAAIIRALIDLGMDSDVDLAGVQSEEEVVERFKQATQTNE